MAHTNSYDWSNHHPTFEEQLQNVLIWWEHDKGCPMNEPIWWRVQAQMAIEEGDVFGYNIALEAVDALESGMEPGEVI